MTENPLKRPSGSEAALTEQELLEQLRSKDPAAQRRFYERYVGSLAAVCYRYVPEPAAAKDVLQESFIKIFGSLDRFVYRGEGSLRAWSTRIVVNTAIKSLRGRTRFTSMDELPELADEPEMPLVERVPPEVIQGFIKALPDGYRTVFNLFVFEEKSHREIAGLLGIKEDSSASQLARARAVLARQINAYLKEHETE